MPRLFCTFLVAATLAVFAPALPAQADLPDADSFTLPRPAASYAATPAPVAFDLFRGTRMFMGGAVNGARTEMMLDTGASSTVLDTAFARRIGVPEGRKVAIRGAGGSTPGELAAGLTIEIGGLTLRDTSVLVMDLAPVSAAIGRPIPVILGHDAIDAGPVRIDFPRRTMTFVSAASFEAPAGAEKLTLGHDGPFRSVPIAVAGLPAVEATFDIGNAGTIVLSKPYWESQPSLAKLAHAETVIGGVGGLKKARRVTIPEMHFAGQTLTDVPAVLNEDAEALPTEGANVGIEMLKPFVVTADYANDVLYVERAGEWTGFRRDRAGVMSQLAGDRLRLRFVSRHGPAAAAGLKAGDEIVAIDGRRIGADFYASRDAEWSLGAAGREVVLTLADGREIGVTLRDYF